MEFLHNIVLEYAQTFIQEIAQCQCFIMYIFMYPGMDCTPNEWKHNASVF